VSRVRPVRGHVPHDLERQPAVHARTPLELRARIVDAALRRDPRRSPSRRRPPAVAVQPAPALALACVIDCELAPGHDATHRVHGAVRELRGEQASGVRPALFFAQKARDRGCPADTERLKPDGGWWMSWFVGATGGRAEMPEEE
jgi:hypothetical protein